MLALCREHRLEHRTKHIALRYFLARELQQRGQLRLAYVASEANTADIFTKALAPGDHQRFCTLLGFPTYAGTPGAQRRRRRVPSTPPIGRPLPMPVMPTPSASTSDAADSERIESPRHPLPQVRVPVFLQSSRPQGKKKRVQDAETPSPRHRMTKRARKAYTAKEKLYWLIDAQPDLSVRKLASLAKVQPKQIRVWKRLKERLEIAARCRRCLGGAGRKPNWPMMETTVYRSFLSHRGKGLPMRVLNAYPLNLIVNADQAPLFLEMPAERTLEMKGARTVHVPTAGYEKERLTVMLAVTAGGMKLPPYVVFKRETLPKIPVPRGVVIRVQDKGWMDEKLVQDWAAQVLVPFLKSLREEGGQRKEALLVLDSYRGHITEAVGQTMKLFKLTCAVIPVGNLKKPPAEKVLCWIAEAWADVPEELINKSFITCGISNAVDGSEDHLIHAHLRDTAEVEVMEDVCEEELERLVPNPFYPNPLLPLLTGTAMLSWWRKMLNLCL
ncbi:unnamed protein product [Closterium sp. NIES-54]